MVINKKQNNFLRIAVTEMNLSFKNRKTFTKKKYINRNLYNGEKVLILDYIIECRNVYVYIISNNLLYGMTQTKLMINSIKNY